MHVFFNAIVKEAARREWGQRTSLRNATIHLDQFMAAGVLLQTGVAAEQHGFQFDEAAVTDDTLLKPQGIASQMNR